MKISLLLALLGFAGCSSGISRAGQNEFSERKMKILFQGRLNSLPSVLKGKPLRVESRFYRCTETDFGKLDADKGIYPRKKDDCRDRFISSSFSFSAEQVYKFEQEISAGWTHGFIRLLDTEEISGKYSPGDNPFWFSPEDLNGGHSIYHDFSFISMKNPIPEKKQEELAARFAPIIVMKKGKKFYPANLEKYHSRYKVEKYSGTKPDSGFYEVPDPGMDEYLVLDESLYGTGDTHLYFHVRPADVSVSGVSPKALPGWRDNRNYVYRAGKGETVISYYFWYDYNEGPTSFGNSHEGDLESFAVLLDSAGNPRRVMATGHNHVMIDTAWENINSFRNHPVLYIAHGNKGADGGNPTSFYGGHTVSLDAGNPFFTFLTSPMDIFPEIGKESELIIPSDLKKEDLVRLRIGPGEWIDKNTKYLDASPYVSRSVKKLVRWGEPGWIGDKSSGSELSDERLSEIFRFRGRLGRHPRSSLRILELKQYGRSPVNVPFKMNDEQHFTLEKPQADRCEKGLSGDYCPKFTGDRKTPQF